MAAIMGGLNAETYDRQYSDSYLLKRIFSYFAKHRNQLLTIVAMVTLIAVVTSIRPVVISAGIDALELPDGSNSLPLLIGALFLTEILEYGGNWVRRRLMSRV